MVINHGAVRNNNMYTCSALYVTLKLGLRQRYHVDQILTKILPEWLFMVAQLNQCFV